MTARRLSGQTHILIDGYESIISELIDLVERLAADLTHGFGRANLARMRKFFLTWPNIIQTPSGQLEGSQSGNWTLVRADFTRCKLNSVRFENANLTEANFIGADLTFANFVGSDLFGADFRYAINKEEIQLAGTNLRETKGLTDQQIQRAFDHGAVMMSLIDFNFWHDYLRATA